MDVLIAGAGPAGSVAAIVLARAGVSVRLVDRASFPRDKLCGDTLNPGTLSLLDRLGPGGDVRACGLRIDGMVVSGEHDARIEARYPAGLHGVAIPRSELDTMLLEEAMRAGAAFDPGVAVRRAVVSDDRGDARVTGASVATRGGESVLSAPVIVGADGRRSALAFGLGLVRHPATPQRWAVGAYYANVSGLSSMGEMHIRQGRYIGIAPARDGLANVCLVRPSGAGDPAMHDPVALLSREIARDARLAARFQSATLVGGPTVLGPLAVDATGRQVDGLILAGDAAGFIDPMTGDGLRFAIQGGMLAARAALDALEHGWVGVHDRLAAERRQMFAAKWRLNRALRSTVAFPTALRAAVVGARVAPALVRALVARAGDCALAL